jgi:hypothetical protein
VPSATVRQTQLAGPLDSSGYNATISAGAALNFNVDATPDNVVLTFANGFGAGGAVDTYTQLTADASNQGALNASNTHYLHATRVSASSVTWGQSLIPPQYGYAFDRTKGALLNFEAADASTTMVDAFGNTWTAAGNAQIDTAQFKFGTASLLGDGTGDWIVSNNFTTFGDGSWEVSLWYRPASVGADQSLVHFSNAGQYGVQIIMSTATAKIGFYVSSNGSSWDVASNAVGASTVSINTWYKIRLVFDALGGTYKLYQSTNGAAEVLQGSATSSALVCAVTSCTVGGNSVGGGSSFNGHIDAFRFLPCATATAAETPSASAPTITDYPVHFFSIPQMKMYEVTAASTSAGVNPTMTQTNRVFVAEADTGAGTVSAVRNYDLRGERISPLFGSIAASQANSTAHSLGLIPRQVQIDAVCVTAGGSYVVGDRIINPVGTTFDANTGGSVRGATIACNKRNVYLLTGTTNGVMVNNKAASNFYELASAGSWQLQAFIKRGW